MIKNAREKGFLSELRINDMKVMKWCLEAYKDTKDEMYYEWAKVFGEWSKLHKKQHDELT